MWCQYVFARTKILLPGYRIPRADGKPSLTAKFEKCRWYARARARAARIRLTTYAATKSILVGASRPFTKRYSASAALRGIGVFAGRRPAARRYAIDGGAFGDLHAGTDPSGASPSGLALCRMRHHVGVVIPRRERPIFNFQAIIKTSAAGSYNWNSLFACKVQPWATPQKADALTLPALKDDHERQLIAGASWRALRFSFSSGIIITPPSMFPSWKNLPKLLCDASSLGDW